MSDTSALLAWLTSNGARLNGATWPAYFGNSRGVAATRDFGPNEPFFNIPESLLLTPAKARASLPLLANVQFDHRDYLVLAIFLMHERRKHAASFWHPYIASLPSEAPNLIKWSKSEADELHDPSLPKEAQNLHGNLSKVFAQLQTEFASLVADFSLADFEWASLMVDSRAFGRRLESAALVPFADMLNHGPVQVKYALEDGYFSLFPTGKYRVTKGQEIFNSYGRLANRHLILHYGFALAGNSWDFVRIQLVVDDKVPLASRKREVLAQSELKSPLDLCAIPVPPEPLVRFFRIVALNADELALVKAHARGPGNAIAKPISLDNEFRALEAAYNSVRLLTRHAPTTERQDVERLECMVDSPASRLVFALRYRIGQKRIVRFTLQYLGLVRAVVERMKDCEMPLKQAADLYPKAQTAVLKRVYDAGNFAREVVIDENEVMDELGL